MSTKLALSVSQRDHVRGPGSAPLTLVEYGDFECPHCGRAYGVVKDLEEELGTQLRVVFRHFPLATIHPFAELAAQAAEAAGEQGKFWEMHDILFENQEALAPENLIEYAQALALDLADFEEALRSGRHVPRVKEDFISGVRSGVNGTPAFFVNGQRHDGAYEYPELLRALREAALAGAR